MSQLENLSRMFKKATPMLLGVDIGSHSVKAVLLSKHDGYYRVEATAIESIPKGAMSERSINDIEAVARVISKIRKKIPKSVQYAAAAVSGQTVINKIIYMDITLTDDELDSQIQIEADSLIPYPLDEVSIDFERLGPNSIDPAKVNVLLSAARTENIEARVRALQGGGFTARVVDVESYSLARVCELIYGQLPNDARKKNVALVDIGATMTLISIVHDGEVVYTRDQMFGGEQFTQSIVSYYNKSFDEAELAKISGDLPPNYTFEVLAPFQTALLQQVRRAVQMYLASSGKDTVDYIVLSGGTALINGLDRLLVDELGIHSVIAQPFVHAQVASNIDIDVLHRIQPQLMVATGLALRSFSSCHI